MTQPSGRLRCLSEGAVAAKSTRDQFHLKLLLHQCISSVVVVQVVDEPRA